MPVEATHVVSAFFHNQILYVFVHRLSVILVYIYLNLSGHHSMYGVQVLARSLTLNLNLSRPVRNGKIDSLTNDVTLLCFPVSWFFSGSDFKIAFGHCFMTLVTVPYLTWFGEPTFLVSSASSCRAESRPILYACLQTPILVWPPCRIRRGQAS